MSVSRLVTIPLQEMARLRFELVSDNLPEVNAYDDGIDMFLLRSKPRLQPISYDTSVALPLS
jgi:hypothetical protein